MLSSGRVGKKQEASAAADTGTSGNELCPPIAAMSVPPVPATVPPDPPQDSAKRASPARSAPDVISARLATRKLEIFIAVSCEKRCRGVASALPQLAVDEVLPSLDSGPGVPGVWHPPASRDIRLTAADRGVPEPRVNVAARAAEDRAVAGLAAEAVGVRSLRGTLKGRRSLLLEAERLTPDGMCAPTAVLSEGTFVCLLPNLGTSGRLEIACDSTLSSGICLESPTPTRNPKP